MPAQKKIVVTAARIEKWLDMVAELMDRAGSKAELYLPVWRALERELAKRQEAEASIAAARARLTRSRNQTAERSA
jgi:hypothetical protein